MTATKNPGGIDSTTYSHDARLSAGLTAAKDVPPDYLLIHEQDCYKIGQHCFKTGQYHYAEKKLIADF